MNTNNSNDFLGTEPVGKLLFRLALPAITAQIINLLYNLVDRVYIGHMPGDGPLALTGVGVCMPVIMIVSAFAALVSMGGAPRASIFMGKGEQENAEKILGNCLILQLVLSALLTFALLIWNRDLLLVFGASENTIDYAVSYMAVYAVGTVFVQLTLGMNAFITAQGFAKTGMLSVLIGAVCNIVLDPVFIYGFHMGVKGAALATVISQAVSAIWVLAFLSGKKTVLRIRKKNLGLRPGALLPCMALGISPFIMQASESVIMVCFNSSLLKYGGDIAVGAMTILTSIMQFSMLPLQGVAQGAQPITSYNFGAGNVERVKKVFGLLLTVSLAYSHDALGACHVVSTAVCHDIYAGCGVDCIYGMGASDLYGGSGNFRSADGVSDDVHFSGKCKGVYFSGSHAEIHPFDTAHLYSAAFLCGSDLRGISGGTCGGFSVGGVCGDAVCVSVSESDSGNGGEKG